MDVLFGAVAVGCLTQGVGLVGFTKGAGVRFFATGRAGVRCCAGRLADGRSDNKPVGRLPPNKEAPVLSAPRAGCRAVVVIGFCTGFAAGFAGVRRYGALVTVGFVIGCDLIGCVTGVGFLGWL